MSLFDKINELVPELMSEMTTQAANLEDGTQMLELLTDQTLVKGSLKEWRKAVFHVLDCGLRLLGIIVDDAKEHLSDSFSLVSAFSNI